MVKNMCSLFINTGLTWHLFIYLFLFFKHGITCIVFLLFNDGDTVTMLMLQKLYSFVEESATDFMAM